MVNTMAELHKFHQADAKADKMRQPKLIAEFESLSHVAQNMFLDVVSVLHGQDSRGALLAWQAWWAGQGDVKLELQELQQRGLISIDQEMRLVADDKAMSLGRAILKDPGSPFFGSRAWEEDGKLVNFFEVCISRCAPQAVVLLVDTDCSTFLRIVPTSLLVVVAQGVWWQVAPVFSDESCDHATK